MLSDPSRFLLGISEIGTALQSHARFRVRLGQRTGGGDKLLDVVQFGSQDEKFCFGGKSARVFGIGRGHQERLPPYCDLGFECLNACARRARGLKNADDVWRFFNQVCVINNEFDAFGKGERITLYLSRQIVSSNSDKND